MKSFFAPNSLLDLKYDIRKNFGNTRPQVTQHKYKPIQSPKKATISNNPNGLDIDEIL